MNLKKTFLLASMLCLWVTGQAQIPVYAWQGWQDGMTRQSLVRDFKQWKTHGVVGICFNAGTDSAHIAIASQAAHEAGLEYHAWIPTMIQSGLSADCYTVNRLGQSAYDQPPYVPYYTTLDPRNPKVHKFFVDQFSKIAKMPYVDYVQLDYIRYADVILAKGLWEKYGLTMNGEYPAADFCYCDDCVRIFQDQTGINIRKVTDPSKVEEWAQFRCDAVTDLVNEIATAVHAQGKKLSADVFPGPKSYARWMVRQEWDKWNLDAVFPMNYNDFYEEPASWVGTVTREEVNSVAGKDIPVYSGLFICHDWQHKASVIDPENSGLIPSEMATAVSGAIQAGAKGICLFTPGSMTDEHWKQLDAAVKLESEKVSTRPLSKSEAEKARQTVINDFTSEISNRTKDMYDKQIIYEGNRQMPLHWEVYGEKPADGRSLWISLHGGGNTRHDLNIQQWTNQWRLYKPAEGVYLCPLSPVDDWNMWCQPDLDQFYHDIILMAVAHLDVNPDKVYILGYSAGGDGVWRMAPRMADNWAAASMMAGHPGDVRLENLRNTPFMVWCGSEDSAYQRNTLDAQRILQLDSLQRQDPQGYIHEGHIVAGKGHWMQQADTAAISWMAKYERNPYPKTIVWQQEEVLRPSFYWITAPQSELARYKQVRLHVEGNTIYLDRCDYSQITLSLNDEIVNLDKPVKVVYQGKTLLSQKLPRTSYNLFNTLRQREDTQYAFPAQCTIKL